MTLSAPTRSTRIAAALSLALAAGPALADINIGVAAHSLRMTILVGSL